MAVPDPARVDFCVEDVAHLGLAQQEALDAPSVRLVRYVLLDGEAVLCGNHPLIEAELLIYQVQEAPEGNEAVTFHDSSETGGVRDEVVAGPLPVALIPVLDNALLHLRPKAEECFQLVDSDGLKILGIV